MEILRLPGFAKDWRKLRLSESDYADLVSDLILQPDVGDVIPGARGLRKIRIKLPGKGKRGGGRVIYAIISQRKRLILATVYAKSQYEDLDADEYERIADTIESIHQELT